MLAGAVDEPGTLEPVYPTLLPNYEQPVLTVKTSILGALYSGDQPKGRTIIQVVEGPVRRRFTDAENEILDLLNQPESHIAPWLGLKQVVDCRLPKRASYQSIVMQGMELRRLKTPAISRTPFKVRVSRYQALPIVDTLGLQVSQTDPGDDTTIDTIEAAFGIWVRMDLEAQRALNVCSRAGSSGWHYATEHEIDDKGFSNQDLFEWILGILLDLLLVPLGLIGILPKPWWPKLRALTKRLKKTRRKPRGRGPRGRGTVGSAP